MSTTPEVPATSHWPSTSFTSSMWTSSGVPRLKTITAFFEKESNVASSSNGKGGTTIRTPTWKPLFDLQLRIVAVRKVPEEERRSA